jgi:FkbM family methyltransferase
MKNIIRFILNKIPNNKAKSLLLGHLLSVTEGRRISVDFLDRDYVYIWDDGARAYVDDALYFKPISTVMAWHKVFLHNYTPKLGDIVVDVGAGYGSEVSLLSNLVGKNGHLYLIEADPFAFKKLEKLVEYLKIQNCTLLNIAVSSKNEMLDFSFDVPGSVNNRVGKIEQCKNTVKVPAFTLDSIVRNNNIKSIDYIKINIEGAESEAIEGFNENKKIVKNWCISCHDFLNIKELETYETIKCELGKFCQSVTKYPSTDVSRCETFYLYASSSKSK